MIYDQRETIVDSFSHEYKEWNQYGHIFNIIAKNTICSDIILLWIWPYDIPEWEMGEEKTMIVSTLSRLSAYFSRIDFFSLS